MLFVRAFTLLNDFGFDKTEVGLIAQVVVTTKRAFRFFDTVAFKMFGFILSTFELALIFGGEAKIRAIAQELRLYREYLRLL